MRVYRYYSFGKFYLKITVKYMLIFIKYTLYKTYSRTCPFTSHCIFTPTWLTFAATGSRVTTGGGKEICILLLLFLLFVVVVVVKVYSSCTESERVNRLSVSEWHAHDDTIAIISSTTHVNYMQLSLNTSRRITVLACFPDKLISSAVGLLLLERTT